MSDKFNETVNQFNFGDVVREKGKQQVMRVISNIPGGGLSIEQYLKTDRFTCEWTDAQGHKQTGTFNGADLESA
ncbi:MAG TPA: hypothetical protein VIN07_06645 [Flavipsychrobacter sp.]